jgi:diguanylate cyclase (GGDEF)-like protein
MIDLDHFKAYNDEHGHQAGDRFLKQSAAAWGVELRATDFLARYGAEFFPGSSGAVYRSAASGTDLELARSWGDPAPFEAAFPADSCWAFRRGRLHVRREADDLPCAHLSERCRSACAPLLAQGEILGILVVCVGPDGAVPDDLEERARSLGEHLSLALANILLRETLRAQSIRDPLTGLYNRRYLDEHLRREFHRSARSGTPIGLLAIDLDHFKAYNDAYGHAAGDTALMSIASMLRLRSRDEDFVCRHGGEEFLVVLPGATTDDAEQRAEDLRRACADLPFGTGRTLTMSVGVASFPEHGTAVDDVLAAVDEALYAAKRGGRDRVARASSPASGGGDGPGASGPTTLSPAAPPG